MFQKKIFIFMPLSLWSIMMIISSNSWISMWMGLEINLMSTIPLLYINKNIYASEASTKYFIVQAFASSLFLYSIISMPMFPSWLTEFKFIMIMSLLMKLGMPPFHFWLPDVVSGLSWTENMIILIIQKIAPMIILMNLHLNLNYMSIIIIISSLISSIQGINQTDLRKLMAYSSMNHMSWMILSMIKSINLWMIYFFMYTLISFTIMKMLLLSKTYWIKDLSKNNKLFLIIISLNLLSMGGLPPMVGFLPKWLTIQYMVKDLPITTTILIILSIITLYFYMRLTISAFSLTNKITKINMQVKKMNFNMMFYSTIMIVILLIAPLMINFNV